MLLARIIRSLPSFGARRIQQQLPAELQRRTTGDRIASWLYSRRLPIGVELIGRAWSEPQLISFAYAYEQATHHRRPPAATPAISR
jgi:Asp-tRNA(Asn)/Glu-tRNA(Gln) amidotransferase A subunit family amidase